MSILKTIGALILSIVPLRTCCAPICSALVEFERSCHARILRAPTLRPFGDVGELDDGRLVAIHLPERNSVLVTSGGTRDWNELQRTEHLSQLGGEGLILTENDHWWYGTSLQLGDAYGTLFIHSDGGETPRRTFVKHDGQGLRLFLAIDGNDPRGLHLSSLHEEALEVLEVDRRGVKRRWVLNTPPRRLLQPLSWSAEILPDKRIALVSLAGEHTAPDEVLLRLLGDDGQVEERVLASGNYSHLATAASTGGELAIAVGEVGPNRERTMIGAVINPAALQDPRWMRLSESSHTSGAQVVATANGFVAAWVSITVDGTAARVNARELKRGTAGLIEADIGSSRVSPSGYSLLSVRAHGETVAFYFEDDNRDLLTRTVPESLSSFELLRALSRVCPRELR